MIRPCGGGAGYRASDAAGASAETARSGRIANPLVAARLEARGSMAGTTTCDIRDLNLLK
jgi:hypothetical protein